MTQKMVYVFGKIRRNPVHTILAVVNIVFGLYLIFTNNYFSWPPLLARTVSSVLGTCAVVNGLGVLYVTFAPIFPLKIDRFWLLSTAAFLGFEAFMEVSHVLLGLGKHTLGLVIAVIGYMLLTVALAYKR